MSRQSPPAPADDDDQLPVDAHPPPHRPSPAPPPPSSPSLPPPVPPPDPLRRPPPSSVHHPSLAPAPSQSQSASFQPQTTHNPRQQLGPGPDQRQHQQHQLQQPIPLQLQPAPASPVQSYPQNRQITLEPQRPSASSPKHQSAKGGVRGRITVVCAEVLLFSPSELARVCSLFIQCKRLKLRCDRQRCAPAPRPRHPFQPAHHPPSTTHSLQPHRPCTSCVKRACTERCKYRSELDFVPPPDPPSKPSVTLYLPLAYSTHPALSLPTTPVR
jgi:hypothetical protein